MADLVPFLSDADFTLYQGNCLEVLRGLPDESIHCVVTSPPYWGLRDYGTGGWEGGDPDCDHLGAPRASDKTGLSHRHERPPDQVLGQPSRLVGTPYCAICGKCGAHRVDQQLGLEATPDEYVARMIEVFREIRRVLRSDGTCWLNLGDSYISTPAGNSDEAFGAKQASNQGSEARRAQVRDGKAVHSTVLRPYAVQGLPPKNLVGIPWRVAFALQADGWWLRSDIIWAKPNPMPESVTDRPTKAHEYVFMLAKSARYFFDQDAIREDYTPDNRLKRVHDHRTDGGHENYESINGSERWAHSGRNARSVWEIATQPYPEAHFAVYPEELVRRCIAAGCPENGTVLDPFMGSGTTALVARKLVRQSVGIELNPDYCDLAARRLGQQSLFA